MGKFSQPRKTQPLSDETVVLPRVPVSAEPENAPVLPQDSYDIPTPEEDFDEYDPTTGKRSGNTRKVVLVSVCAVLAALLLGAVGAVWFLFGQDPNDHKILNNVYIANVNLGGMTKEEAKDALRKATDNTFSRNDMVVELPDMILTLSPGDTGAMLDVDAAVEAAYDFGRSGTRAENAAALENSLVTDHPIALLPYLNLNLDYIRAELDDYGKAFNSTYIASGVEVTGDMPVLDASAENFDPEAPGQTLVVTMGNPGRYVDIEEVYNRILDAYSFNIFLVQVSMDEEETIPEEIDLEVLYEQFHQDPVDASIDHSDYSVIPETYGYGFDLEAAQEMLDNASYGDTFKITLNMVAPKMLAEDMRNMLFRDVLCEYKTEHTNNENRNTNLRLACEAINGTILYPGDTFDYNTVVGKRTADKGYKTAAAYSSGKTVETLCGGICQVSSTIYYCCLIADLEIVNRLPHSYVSSYMPMGMDATVSWGGPEFTFRNNTNYPIRIETWVEGGYVHCKLVGTDEKDYYIVMEYEVIGSQSPDTVYEEYPEKNKEGYRDGEVIQTSYRGYTVKTYKCKYDKTTDELIAREFDQTSKYKKRDKIIAKIVKETEPPTEAPEEMPEEPKPTDPPATTPPATEPPTPPATEPPAPPATDPPAPPATEPPAAPAGDGSGEA